MATATKSKPKPKIERPCIPPADGEANPLSPKGSCGNVGCPQHSSSIRRAIKDKLSRRYKGAWAIVGGLSAPKKMPCLGISLPASACITGGKLMNVANSICGNCYAKKHNYLYDNVQDALHRRLAGIIVPGWADAMATLINASGVKHFRWHDSGDIQSEYHLSQILRVMELTPDVAHWIPTREYKFVGGWIDGFPSNGCIRLSQAKIDQWVTTGIFTDFPFSGVVKSKPAPDFVWLCPAKSQGGYCGNCRKCWDNKTKAVGYKNQT